MDRAKMKRVHLLTVLLAILAQKTVQGDPTLSGKNSFYLIIGLPDWGILKKKLYLSDIF